MRIEDKSQLGLNKLNDTADKKKVASSASKSTDTASASDSVSLSDSAKDMANIKSSLQKTPEVRAELVAKLKNEIESGQYNVTGRQVAEKIVQTAIDGLF